MDTAELDLLDSLAGDPGAGSEASAAQPALEDLEPLDGIAHDAPQPGRDDDVGMDIEAVDRLAQLALRHQPAASERKLSARGPDVTERARQALQAKRHKLREEEITAVADRHKSQ